MGARFCLATLRKRHCNSAHMTSLTEDKASYSSACPALRVHAWPGVFSILVYMPRCAHQYLLPSSDPRIFGPPAWECLHILAQNYPFKADVKTQRRCRRFLFCLSHLLPCEHCGKHFRRFLRRSDLLHALLGRASLVNFMVDAHNSINAHTRPDQPPFGSGCAEAQYMYMPPKSYPPPELWT